VRPVILEIRFANSWFEICFRPIQFVSLPAVSASVKRFDGDYCDVANVQITDFRIAHGRVKRSLRPNARSVKGHDVLQKPIGPHDRVTHTCRLELVFYLAVPAGNDFG